MRCAVLSFAFASVSFGQIASRDAVASWFPVHVGDKWIYSHETRDDLGDGVYCDERLVGGSLQTAHWETEETTTGLWAVPEGALVGRTVRIVAGSPPPGYRTDIHDPAYLIRGNCLYSTEVEWDPINHQLTPPPDKGAPFHVISIAPYPGSGMTVGEARTPLVRVEPASPR